MILGLDLDNTILDYSPAIRLAAQEALGLDLPSILSKVDQKKEIIEACGEESWTLVQGYSYGKYAWATRLFPGFVDFLDYVLQEDYHLQIFSHKSKFPLAGPKVNLRDAAVRVLEREGVVERLARQPGGLSPIHFFDLKSEKIANINSLEAGIFVDDLIEVAQSVKPSWSRFHIFCEEESHLETGVICVKNWQSMRDHIGNLR